MCQLNIMIQIIFHRVIYNTLEVLCHLKAQGEMQDQSGYYIEQQRFCHQQLQEHQHYPWLMKCMAHG